jgi:hypothetical protein
MMPLRIRADSISPQMEIPGEGSGRILLVNPWIVDFAAYDFWIKPLGLLMLGSLLNRSGYTVNLLDCMDRRHPVLSGISQTVSSPGDRYGTGHFYKVPVPKPQILKDIPRRLSRYGLPKEMAETCFKGMRPPDLICVTSGMTYWYPGVVEMIRLLRRLFPGVPVILGGIYATLCPEHARIHSGADRVIEGAANGRILELAADLTGIQAGSPPASPVTIPPPLYSLYPDLSSVALMTSLGCPFRCPYCASFLLSPGYSARDPGLVVSEIREMARIRGVKDIAFYDDALLFKAESHLIPVLEELIRLRLPVGFHTPNGLSPRQITPELAVKLRKAGFRTLRLSYETADPVQQIRFGGKVTNADLENAVHFLRDSGFPPEDLGVYVMMGLPDQPVAEVLESVIFVSRLGVPVHLAAFSPIPGTPMWEECRARGLVDGRTDPVLTNNSIFGFHSGTMSWKQFSGMGTLVSKVNRSVLRRENPLDSPEVIHWSREVQTP